MALIDEVKKRHGGTSSARLIQLTNDDTSATTINDDILDAACDDAIAMFHDVVGIEFDDTNNTHVYIAVQAVILFLEEYKSRDAGILLGRRKSVFAALSGLRGRVYITAQTNSVLAPSKETSGAKPDMDKSRQAFTSNVKRQDIEEYAENE
jgi:hypothetical protein